jgi:SAM-dependent methyltransferase
MEHVEDPLRALKSIGRVLRPSGVAFLALPDKRFTFDIDRPVTPLEHIIRDHAEGPDWSAAQHYEEWVRCVDKLTGEAHQRKSSHMFRERTNIHFHVWDYPAMMELFAYVSRLPEIGLEVELSTRNGIEVIWILKKTAKA